MPVNAQIPVVSVWEYVLLALRPVPRFSEWIGLAGMTVPGVLSYVSSGSVLGSITAVLLGALVLSLIAGYNLHSAAVNRDNMPVEFVEAIEPTTQLLTADGGNRFAAVTYFWLVVKNAGPTGEFEAQYSHVRGFGSEHESSNAHHLAWENSSTELMAIGRGRQQRLMVASTGLFTRGGVPTALRFLWFNLPYTPAWGSGEGHRMSRPLQVGDTPIQFRIDVYDRLADRERHLEATIDLADPNLPRFAVTEAPAPSESGQRPRRVRSGDPS